MRLYYQRRNFIAVAILTLLSCTDTWARPPHARKVCGTVEKIDRETHALALSVEKGGHPLNVMLNRDTRFIHNWKFTDSASLTQGLRACVYYRSPFFGKPFVTKIVWSNGA